MRSAVALGGILAALTMALPSADRLDLLARQPPAGRTVGASSPGLLGVLAVEDARAPLADDLRVLLTAARSSDVVLQRAAVRALGRLERRDLVTDLMPYVQARDLAVAEEAATALALAFRGEPVAAVPAEPQKNAAVEALALAPRPSAYRTLGRLPDTTANQFRRVQEILRSGLAERPPSVGALRGLESLARLNRKLLPFDDATLERLRSIAVSRDPASNSPELRRNAIAALVAALGTDVATVTAALKDDDQEVRRFAALAVAGAGLTIDKAARLDLLKAGSSDRSPMVRLEALKGWVKYGTPEQGCGLVTSALGDREPYVVLAALDSLADQCKGDVLVTDRLTAEARSPAAIGNWQREAHALVALAKRAPDRAAIAITGFASHGRWQVRMYAARAAAAMDDGAALSRFAQDDDDNVREAALPGLRRLLGAGSDDAFIAALQRPDYQLIRSAARELKGSAPSPAIGDALGAALTRVTAEKKETSRDPRMAIIERLGELGTERDAPALRPLLRDFDPVVAAAAAAPLRRWTSEELTVDPQLLPRMALPTAGELAEDVQALVTMESGRKFVLRFETEQAPLTRTRFLRLARARYYDGLTFHRVVPNAFIQGGSPGANEYAGDRLYMRDEVGMEMHTRGSVGISTRGRDTGDAQIFINLVDNPFLDYQYTVFARVCGDGMETVDRIQEGDRIQRVEVEKGDRCN